MEINLTTIFDNFYHTRVFVLVILSVFTCLISLRLDGVLTSSYWLIFTPLWIWKSAAFVGVLTGSIAWLRLGDRKFETESFIQYKAMVLSFMTNILLFFFEIVVCEKLETKNMIPWTFCFLPLYLLSVVSIGSMLWSIKYARSYEMELFCSMNMLQFVLMALRLDSFITCSWLLVFSPVWLVMSLSLIILLYYMTLTILYTVRRSLSHSSQAEQLSEQQTNVADIHLQTKWFHLFYYILLFSSILVFSLLLTQKLDAESHEVLANRYRSSLHSTTKNTFNDPLYENVMNYRQQMFTTPGFHEPQDKDSDISLDSLSYLAVFGSLNGAYISLILLSFNSRHGNIWWFGLGRRDYCQMFLCLCPIFNVYGNINLKFSLTSRKVQNRSTANDTLIVVNASHEITHSNSLPSFVITQHSSSVINNLSLNIDLDQSSTGTSSNEIFQSAQSISRVSTARKGNSLQASDSEIVALRSTGDKNEENGASLASTEIVMLELPD